ncbi:hypothetical protein [Okeania sp. KiyG1]|uniref:hypothetical protein n=1 Tax=Okeania sp. KiyG1 TaxID=2720165 RepID=UPI001921B035|nr:hypothetical protein [Okeania sp. KiyG1]GGA00934.1 hypothetical protein CYANOKiyG1_12720 [Okeania sp. KiyG1]
MRKVDVILVLDLGILSIKPGNNAELMAKREHHYYLNRQQFKRWLVGASCSRGLSP